jgi:hypothetical protein
MKATLLLSLAVLGTAACASNRTAVPGGSPSSATTPRAEAPAAANSGKARGEPARGPRKLNGVPPGHYPKAGECRLWHSGRPPGQQPKATACRNLIGHVPDGAFILHGDRAYDSKYDWVAQASRERGSVPQAIIDIVRSIR